MTMSLSHTAIGNTTSQYVKNHVLALSQKQCDTRSERCLALYDGRGSTIWNRACHYIKAQSIFWQLYKLCTYVWHQTSYWLMHSMYSKCTVIYTVRAPIVYYQSRWPWPCTSIKYHSTTLISCPQANFSDNVRGSLFYLMLQNNLLTVSVSVIFQISYTTIIVQYHIWRLTHFLLMTNDYLILIWKSKSLFPKYAFVFQLKNCSGLSI